MCSALNSPHLLRTLGFCRISSVALHRSLLVSPFDIKVKCTLRFILALYLELPAKHSALELRDQYPGPQAIGVYFYLEPVRLSEIGRTRLLALAANRNERRSKQ